MKFLGRGKWCDTMSFWEAYRGSSAYLMDVRELLLNLATSGKRTIDLLSSVSNILVIYLDIH
jgi:hypothetical protein